MSSFLAFTKKEITEQVRSGKLMFLCILFVLFGIMNPAIAKMTPWLLEVMSESLAESGMTVTAVEVSAMDSWVQFFKNIPMALIAFVLLEGSIFTKEYQTGTLILSLTKGLERYKVVVSKTIVLMLLWTAGYFACFGITYGYNAYFWDNSVAKSLMFSVISWWLFGVLVVSLIVLFSTLLASSTGVFLGVGAVVMVFYMLALIPKFSEYLPTMLTDGNSLIYGIMTFDDYTKALIVSVVTIVASLVISIPIFNKKHL